MIRPFLSQRWSGSSSARGFRGLSALLVHMVLLSGAFFSALALSYDFHWFLPDGSSWLKTYFFPMLALVLTAKLLVWLAMGLHQITWRYVGLGDLLSLMVGSQVALAVTYLLYLLWQVWGKRFSSPAGFRETVFLLDWLLGFLLLAGGRVVVRLAYEESRGSAGQGRTRLLILGADESTEALLREIARMPEQPYLVVGLLDDAPAKRRMKILGVPVLGTVAELPTLSSTHQVGEILIANGASKEQIRRVMTWCRNCESKSGPIRVRTLPSMADLIVGRSAVGQIRDVSVNDVLGREAIALDLAAVGAMIHQKVVLVSGAGGSIGSEMCRTIGRFEPAALILLDKAENAVFEIERELRRTYPLLEVVPCIGDISDAVRVEQVFGQYHPALVFHAAAHKHVPLAESNPGEAIRNNVFGTKTLADTAAAYGVQQFVMISTDKAVNPTSIMGTTKRCAEIYIQALARRSHTNFITVRFGNVLGSNGSVVPIFKQQIAAGGPVTVTHPEMRRYFMTIPEASQLVLQAGALGQRGEIFVLDMGEPVRILDLARDLITLSGLRPEIDIPIVFTGLRPGEKLYEELSIRGEGMVATRHPKIAIWRSEASAAPRVQAMIDELESLQHCADRARVLEALQTFVPEMQPWQPENTPARPEVKTPESQ